ncbi:RpnC/YadD family protein [Zavarzinella formosa]|uniref:hypothetical protein n=1 Tax=Zavarzinella formosa TaxID=360055 RepID=UPI0002FA483D|nr:hypothetical protein [Zavarzinella formosa]
MRQEKDLAGKWILERHADVVLKLINMPPVESWRAMPTDRVVPRRIPDALFEVKFRDRPLPTPLVFEVENTPSADADRQMLEAIMLVRLDAGVIPDAVLVLLQPRGNADVAGEAKLASAGDTVEGSLKWRVIKLWEQDAEAAFALGDAGLVPWITLMHTTQPADVFLSRCREMIDQQAPPAEREELRIVTGIFAAIRYNNPVLLDLLTGEPNVFESPLLERGRKMVADAATIVAKRESLISVLTARFGNLPVDLVKRLEQVANKDQLNDLIKISASCPDLESFIAQL